MVSLETSQSFVQHLQFPQNILKNKKEKDFAFSMVIISSLICVEKVPKIRFSRVASPGSLVIFIPRQNFH